MKSLKAILIITSVLFLNACKKEGVSPSNYEVSKQQITSMMLQTAEDWSKGDLEAFMNGYIKSDSLKFVGSGGITYGWQQTLENYKKGYPSKDHSGSLNFEIIDISPIENQSYWVMGKYFLSRNVGDANGVFMVIFKKIEGEWKIVADMSCG